MQSEIGNVGGMDLPRSFGVRVSLRICGKHGQDINRDWINREGRGGEVHLAIMYW